MFKFLRRLVAPEVQEAIGIPRIRYSGNDRPRFAHQRGMPRLKKARREHLKRRLEARLIEAEKLKVWNSNLLPPPSGSRRISFSSTEDGFWTNSLGDITSKPVQPRKSIWTSFKSRRAAVNLLPVSMGGL